MFAEGVYWLLDQKKPVFAADHAHWEEFLARRQKFIEQVLEMTGRVGLARAEQAKRVRALEAALDRVSEITPDLCQAYLQAWDRDRRTWDSHVGGLPSGLALDPALAFLEELVQPGLQWRLSEKLACCSGRPLGDDPCSSLSCAPM